ncbi:uncharacterized protein [Littorina saxatilis]|uniref:uncharacterized protein n=1 Tax=Littorina saxatilis TaxID=31220 RepID=UPI0038B65E57
MKSKRIIVLATVFVILVTTIYLSGIASPSHQSNNHRPFQHESFFSSPSSKPSEKRNSVDTDSNVRSEARTYLQAARDIYRRHGVVLFTMVNDAYFPFTASWCCNTAPMTNVHHRALFLTTDRTTGQRLTKLWPDVTVVTLNSSQYAGSQEYSKAGYVRMMVERTRYILHLLEAGVRLLLFEVDCVWLSDPLPHVLTQQAAGDIVGTYVSGTSLTAGGFLLLNPTTATVKLWRRLTDMMDSLYRRLEKRENFAAVSEGDNDQQYFSRLIREKFAGIKVVYLTSSLFPDGKWYRLTDEQRSLNQRPLIINNNWVVGNEAKIKRAKTYGHWFWNEREGSCNSTALQHLF